ncbi:metallophosphoesterase family protein [Alteribacillus sp. HJP-4]|uniref:metallophosphoesterase family protein n=1 Tax=Alteribacillus sp. HJP-4 TaxID=2775394 RepID=UPI0035CCD030
MKIIVISDTHIPGKAKKLPERLLRELSEVDLIVHAGDWQTYSVYEEISEYGPVEGVYGNVDDKEIIQRFPEKKIIEAEGWKIGITHGHGERKTTEKRAADAFEMPIDCIIFGHSHIPMLRYKGKTLLFNPGSVTDKRKLPYYSFGIMEVTKQLSIKHVFYSDKM